MDELTMLHLVALTLALVEGLKVVVKSYLSKELSDGGKVFASMLMGGGLAALVEFAPDAWVRVLPILMVGLAAAGLYSLGKRTGKSVFYG